MPVTLNDDQVRLLDALQTSSVMKGSDLARMAGYTDTKKLATDIQPLVDARLVEASGSLAGHDILFAVFAIRPSNLQVVRGAMQKRSA